jgi:hypothetical protein
MACLTKFVIASPVEVNKEIIKDGENFFATMEKYWLLKLSFLV